MRRFLFSVLLLFGAGVSFSQPVYKNQVVEKVVVSFNDTSTLSFLVDSSLYKEGWDTLAQAKFWKDVICMSSDTCIINVASCRKPLDKVSRSIWMNQSDPEKTKFKDSICGANCYDEGTNLFVTSGKAEFYELKKVLPDISKAIRVFSQNNCDPFFAQAILLIESPGKNKAKSSVGANGPFQLMRSVARKYGLKVSKGRDDRTDLEKSAKVAARLINSSCVPYVKSFLNERSIAFNETDLWFRLLVLHAYHAGAGSVHCVINSLNPSKGGVDLFRQIWQTECGRFKNESQNYSQIALASLVSFYEIINHDGDTIYLVQGDKYLKSYNRKNFKPWEAYAYLDNCLFHYENDLADAMIPYENFMRRINFIRKEFLYIAQHVTGDADKISLNLYPGTEEHLDSLASRLLKRQRFDSAIRLLKLNIDIHPNSSVAYDRLAYACQLSGDKKMAAVYSNRSVVLSKKEMIKGRE
ncbi:MAG: transglycosylase SLT domain-containing protein [Bacteroidetes bacterium]|nr:transglycosylase SLT domain-containing protein [Bacteroidota bacterium]